MINFIKEVEKTYNVSSITVNGVQVWPFLRTSYYSAYGNKYKFNGGKGRLSIGSKIKRVKNVFYGWENLLKKYDFLVFSDTLEKRLVDDKYIDKIAESLILELGEDNVLLIENPVNGSHFRRSEIATNNIISLDLFHIFCYQPFLIKKINIDNEWILKEINKKYRLNINYHRVTTRFFCCERLFKLFYKIYKPKAIFINCYYSLTHQAAIYAAKKMKKLTIELQHGIINNKHPAYNVFVSLDKSFFPDYLFAFGDYVKEIFDKENYFIEKENVIPVGYMYIDYINNEYKPSKETINLFNNFRRKYKKIVAISSQWALENKLIDFLKKSASLSKDILYIFVTRNVNKDYSSVNFPENIIILKHLDVYQIIKEADFHSTLWSTCALEAPALGVPNILINIDGFAKEYYSNLLTNRDVTRFVDTPEEFVDIILNWQVKPKEEIKKLHGNFYKQNHKSCLKKALQKIIVSI